MIITNAKKKKSILENTAGYIDLILEALKKRFSGLSEENSPNEEALKKQFRGLSEENSSNEDLSGAPITGDTILHIHMPRARNIRHESVIDKNLFCLRNIFPCFQMVLAKHIAIEGVTNEYISLVIYAMKNLNIISSERFAFMEQNFHAD